LRYDNVLSTGEDVKILPDILLLIGVTTLYCALPRGRAVSGFVAVLGLVGLTLMLVLHWRGEWEGWKEEWGYKLSTDNPSRPFVLAGLWILVTLAAFVFIRVFQF
jgi:hypothetical protein